MLLLRRGDFSECSCVASGIYLQLSGRRLLVEVRHDGKRVYFASSLDAGWNEQFYPPPVGHHPTDGQGRCRGRQWPWLATNLLLLILPGQFAMCHKALMILPPTDTTRLFRLYWGLNAYVNQQLTIIPKQFTADSFRNIPIEQLAVVRDALIANPELLHRYLAEDPHHLLPEDRDIVSSWRLKRAGQFVVVRHLKKYTVFLDDKPPGHLYGVVGLHSPIDEVLEQKLPLLVSTVLLPFCGVIVTDGLISSTQVHLGRNIQENIRQHYNRIKLRAGITACLDSEERSIQGKPVRRPAPDWGGDVEE